MPTRPRTKKESGKPEVGHKKTQRRAVKRRRNWKPYTQQSMKELDDPDYESVSEVSVSSDEDSTFKPAAALRKATSSMQSRSRAKEEPGHEQQEEDEARGGNQVRTGEDVPSSNLRRAPELTVPWDPHHPWSDVCRFLEALPCGEGVEELVCIEPKIVRFKTITAKRQALKKTDRDEDLDQTTTTVKSFVDGTCSMARNVRLGLCIYQPAQKDSVLHCYIAMVYLEKRTRMKRILIRDSNRVGRERDIGMIDGDGMVASTGFLPRQALFWVQHVQGRAPIPVHVAGRGNETEYFKGKAGGKCMELTRLALIAIMRNVKRNDGFYIVPTGEHTRRVATKNTPA